MLSLTVQILLLSNTDAVTTSSYTTSSPAPNSVTCDDRTGCIITCDGSNSCQQTTIYTQPSLYLTVTASGTSVLSRAVINCPNFGECTINATGSSACEGITVNCGVSGICDIVGYGTQSIHNAMINAVSSTKLTVTADGGYNSFVAEVHCPQNQAQPSCFARVRSDSSSYFTTAYIMSDSQFYVDSIDDIEFQCDANTDWDALFEKDNQANYNSIYSNNQVVCTFYVRTGFGHFFGWHYFLCTDGSDTTIMDGKQCVPWDTSLVTPTWGFGDRPTKSPTFSTAAPTKIPTPFPTHSPSKEPSQIPSISPTELPSNTPTSAPTQPPTSSPSAHPTRPTDYPSNDPTIEPTAITVSPTQYIYTTDTVTGDKKENGANHVTIISDLTSNYIFWIIAVITATPCCFGIIWIVFAIFKKKGMTTESHITMGQYPNASINNANVTQTYPSAIMTGERKASLSFGMAANLSLPNSTSHHQRVLSESEHQFDATGFVNDGNTPGFDPEQIQNREDMVNKMVSMMQNNMAQCTDCAQYKTGQIHKDNGLFYCNECRSNGPDIDATPRNDETREQYADDEDGESSLSDGMYVNTGEHQTEKGTTGR